MNQFKNKTLLITGGTGTFGHTVLKQFLKTDLAETKQMILKLASINKIIHENAGPNIFDDE